MNDRKAMSYDEVAAAYDIRKVRGGHVVHTVSQRCVSCRFLTGSKTYGRESKYFRNPSCDYIGITGRARMCPAGDMCTKYEEGGGENDGFIIDLDVDL